MTDDRDNYLLRTTKLRVDGAGRLAFVFPDVTTEIEPMVEAVLTEPVAEPSVVPGPRGGAASLVTLSVVIPMLEAHGIDRVLAALEESLARAGCSDEILCIDDGSGSRHWHGRSPSV